VQNVAGGLEKRLAEEALGFMHEHTQSFIDTPVSSSAHPLIHEETPTLHRHALSFIDTPYPSSAGEAAGGGSTRGLPGRLLSYPCARQHADTLSQHDDTLSQHADTLSQHTDTLSQHDDTLSQHAGTLSQHADTLSGMCRTWFRMWRGCWRSGWRRRRSEALPPLPSSSRSLLLGLDCLMCAA